MICFGSRSGWGISALNIIYPFSLPILDDLLSSQSCPLILLCGLPGRFSGEIVCCRSISNNKTGACVGWSRGS